MRAVVIVVRVAAVTLLSAGLAGCGGAAPGQAKAEAQIASSSAFLDAERVEAVFASMPQQVDVAVALSGVGRAAPPTASALAFKTLAQRSFSTENAALRATVARAAETVNGAELDRCLSALARAQDATQTQLASATAMQALERQYRARPDGQQLRDLTNLMAQPRLAEEQARTALRIKTVLDELKGAVTSATVTELLAAVPQLIASTRQQSNDESAPGLNISAANEGARGSLTRALLALSPADVAVLTRWYASPQGRTATAKLVQAFQAANDRAGQAMLTDYLNAWKAGQKP